MTRKIKSNPLIKGISFKNGTTALLSQFADDTCLFLHYDEISLKNVLDTLQHIETTTGLKISYDKTVVYRIGSLRNSEAKIYTQKNLSWTNEPFPLLGIQIDHGNVSKLNFEIVIDKMVAVLENWDKRPLTLTGKVLVVNTLCESLFVYKISVLQNIPNDMVTQMENLINKFLWNGKRARIARSTLQASKENGGLRLFSIKHKQQALKLGWIRLIENDPFFAMVFQNNLNIKNPPFSFFDCNLNVNDIQTFVKETDCFWTEILVHWSKIRHKQPQNKTEVLNEIIWYNSFIKSNKKPLCNQNCIEKGIIRISDIVDTRSNCIFMSYDTMQATHGANVSWLEYETIKRSIPMHWRTVLQGTNPDETNTDHTTMREKVMAPRVTGMIYRDLIDYKNHLSKYLKNWHEEGLLDLNAEEYLKGFKQLYKTTPITKLRDFQYRLLLCKIPTNEHLFKWKLTDSNLCQNCKTEVDTIFHCLIYCKYAKRLWKFIQKVTMVHVLEHTKSEIILNYQFTNAVNSIMLITTQYIYRNRCLKTLPNITGLKKELRFHYDMEKYIASKDNKLNKFEKKWSMIHTHLL